MTRLIKSYILYITFSNYVDTPIHPEKEKKLYKGVAYCFKAGILDFIIKIQNVEAKVNFIEKFEKSEELLFFCCLWSGLEIEKLYSSRVYSLMEYR